MLDLIEAGRTHLVLAQLPPWTAGTAAWLAEEAVEPVLAEGTMNPVPLLGLGTWNPDNQDAGGGTAWARWW